MREEPSPCRAVFREVRADDQEALRLVARMHVELLDFGPMSAFGEAFVREVCYHGPLRDGLMELALYEIDGRPAAFVGWTRDSSTFHRRALRNHWFRAGWRLLVSLLTDPRRVLRLPLALRLVAERSTEAGPQAAPAGEILCLAVRPENLTLSFRKRTGLQVSQELFEHAVRHLEGAGLTRMRLFVDADNRPALLLYHRLGGRFERITHAGQPVLVITFDLGPGASPP